MAEIPRGELRGLLHRLFPNYAELEAFIIDHFPDVARHLSTVMDSTSTVNMLFMYQETPEILAALRHYAPGRVERYLREFARKPPEPGPEDEKGAQSTPQDLRSGPIKVACLYEPSDIRYFKQLELHLTLSIRNELITLWHPEKISPGMNVTETFLNETRAAEIVIVLVSPQFAADGTQALWFQESFDRWKRGMLQLLPILVRPTHVERTKLGLLQQLPRSGQAISLAKNADETWVEIMQELETAFQYRSRRAPQPAQPTTQHGVAAPPLPQKRYGIQDIFKLSGFPDHTFVEPVQFRQIIPQLHHLGMGLIIEGPSGIGKTTMVRKALVELGAKNLDRQWIQSTDSESVSELDKLIAKGFSGYLVIDDFHYLDDERVKKVANKLHAVATAFPMATAKMIFIGVQQVGRRLLQARPDLGHRTFSISVARQPADKLAEMISRGEAAANIQFQHRAEMIYLAGGSFSILQLLCFKLATSNAVDRTPLVTKIIQDGPASVLPEIMSQMEGEFDRSLIELVKPRDGSRWGAAALALLWTLAHSDDDIVSIEEVRLRFPSLLVAFDLLQGERLTQIIADSDQLGRWLHYDGDIRLSLHDPRLGFYLRHLKWSSFIERSELSGITLTRDGRLELAASPRKQPLRPPEGTGSPFPNALLQAMREGQVIPFIGSGVPGAIVRTKSKQTLFPALKELVARAARRMTLAGKSAQAQAILALYDVDGPAEVIKAAEHARNALPTEVWTELLQEHFDPDLSKATSASLVLPQTLWGLDSTLMVTDNYDRVLEWACQETLGIGAKVANIVPPEQLGELLRHRVKRPTVWHLFGSIFDRTTLILRADGPDLLFPAGIDRRFLFEQALITLRSLLAQQTFLFIGHGFVRTNSWLDTIFKDAAGPHFAFVSSRELKLARIRFAHLPVEFISCSTAKSLVTLIQQLAEHRLQRGPYA